jgi:hypothetical protein
MTALATSTIDRTGSQASTASRGSPWLRLLRRLCGSGHVARARGVLRGLTGNRRRQPVFRINRVWMDRWVVVRPGATMEHAFPTLGEAVSFVRHEAGQSAATVELFIGDLYVAGFHDPNWPKSLFGVAA